MDFEDIARGWAVYSEDGKRVGDVVEVHDHYLLVSRGLLVVRDVYVPRYAVAAVEERKVHLAINEQRLRAIGWTAPPPPPPPPADSPAPRLVPTYMPDEPGAPAFRDEAQEPAAGEQAEDSGWSFDAAGAQLADGTGAPALFFDDYEDMGIMIGASVEVENDVLIGVRRLSAPLALSTRPIVLLHGWGFDSRIWDYLTLDLPHDYTVVTFDARGYGRSTAPWTGYDIAQAGHDLRVVLRTLDLQDAVLVGLDIGATAALHYVLNGGKRAGQLILVAPAISAPTTVPVSNTEGDAATPGGLAVELPRPLHAWRDELRHDRPRLAERLAELWAPNASAQTRAWLRDGMLAAAPHALLHGLAVLATPDAGAALESVHLPTVALYGRDDPVVDAARGRELVATIPNARLVELDTLGHLPMLTAPDLLVAEIRAAIEGPPREPPAHE